MIAKLKRITALCLCFVLMCSLCACSFYDMLGIDTHDYRKEARVRTLNAESDVALQISEMVTMMVQNTPYLSEFDTPAKAAELYRDGILCYILSQNYSKYNANTELIAQIESFYPTLEITTVIPSVDFESTVYRYFGGTASVHNSSTPLFTYLDKVSAYVSVGIGVDNSATVKVVELYETENTYVVTFYNEMKDTSSDTYRMLLMKREDGTFYMKELTTVK